MPSLAEFKDMVYSDKGKPILDLLHKCAEYMRENCYHDKTKELKVLFSDDDIMVELAMDCMKDYIVTDDELEIYYDHDIRAEIQKFDDCVQVVAAVMPQMISQGLENLEYGNV
tara:strand:+ start:90 stop:428 length:339 start_codon:yes stop_codon:yes gene_type:complete